MQTVAKFTEHKRPWCQSARLLMAAAKEYVIELNTPPPFENKPDKPNWAQVCNTVKAASTSITNRKKAGIYTSFFEVVLEDKEVRCYTCPSEKPKELFFSISPI